MADQTLFKIINNLIYDLNCDNDDETSATIVYTPAGIRIISGNNVKIYNNSINLFGEYLFNYACDSYKYSFDIYISNASANSVDNFDIRNNILANTFSEDEWSGAGASGALGFYTSPTWANSIIDNNLYYINSPSANLKKLGMVPMGTFYDNLSLWKGVTNTDASSIEANPLFSSNIALAPISGSPAFGSGVEILDPISAQKLVPNDLYNISRSNPPSIGAFETVLDVLSPNITFNKIANSLNDSSQILNTIIVDAKSGVNTVDGPNLYFKKRSQPNDSSYWKLAVRSGIAPNYTFKLDTSLIGKLNLYDEIQYFIITRDLATPNTPNYTITSGKPSGSLTSALLKKDNFPILGIIDSYKYLSPISGLKTVGVGGDYTSLTGASGAFEALNNSIFVGDVTLKIISDLNESAVNSLDNYYRKGGNWNLSMVPDTNIERTIAGPIRTNGLIRLNSVRDIKIDGSFKNAGRFLKFVNTTPDTASGAFTILIDNDSLGNGGCKNLTFTNITIVGPENKSTTAHAFLANKGDHDSITFTNNRVYRGYGLLISLATVTKSNDHWIVKGNQFAGSTIASENNSNFGVYFDYSTDLLIENNVISGIASKTAFSGISNRNSKSAIIRNNQINNITTSTANSLYGIYMLSNSGNQIINNSIDNLVSASSAYLYGIYAQYNDKNNFENNKISNITGVSYNYGIWAQYNAQVLIKNNSIQNLTSSSGYLYGIYSQYNDTISYVSNLIDNLTTTGYTYGIDSYYNNAPYFESNKIKRLNTTSYIYGVYLYNTVSGKYLGKDAKFVNNSIALSGGSYVYGIYNYYGTGEKFFHNSICLSGARTSTSTTYTMYFYAASATKSVIDSMVNNTISNQFVNTGTSTSYAMYCSGATTGSYVSFLNNSSNNIYSFGSSTSNVGYYLGAAKASLTDWQNATNQDLNSISANPLFASSSVLAPGQGSPLLGVGVYAGIEKDIMGNVRSTTNPSIGAYEIEMDLAPPVMTYKKLVNTTGFGSLSLAVNIVDVKTGLDTILAPQLYYKKKSQGVDSASWQIAERTGSSPNYSFFLDTTKVGGFKLYDEIQYFIVCKDSAEVPNYGFSSGIPTDTLFDTKLLARNFPIGGTIESFVISEALSGIKTVGVGGDFENFTGSNGVFKKFVSSVVNADLTFKVISNIVEPGLITLNGITREYSNWDVKVVPDAKVERIISGAIPSEAVIRIENTYNLTFDGSFNGEGRYLTIQNTAAVDTKTAAVRLSGNGATTGTGVRKITFKNCNIIGAGHQTATAWAFYLGNRLLDATGTGASSDSVMLINNVIKKAYFGIGVYGDNAANKHTNCMIINNQVGAAKDTSEYINYYGMDLNGLVKGSVIGNEVSNVWRVFGSSYYPAGISVNIGNDSLMVRNNVVRNVKYMKTGGWGAYGISLLGASNYVSVINNLVYDIASDGYTLSASYGAQGIRVYSGIGAKIYHNSVNLYGQFTNPTYANKNSHAFSIPSSTVDSIQILNNSFSNSMEASGSGYAYAVSFWYKPANYWINYNNYYSSGVAPMLAYGAASMPLLTDWQDYTLQDTNSTSENPMYNNDSLLTVQYGSPLLHTGLYISDVPYDFNNEQRANPPSIGAFEKDYDLAGPIYVFNKLSSTHLLASRNLEVKIFDNQSKLDTVNGPYLYYKKTSQANDSATWQIASRTNNGFDYNFYIDYAKIGGISKLDTIQYFMTAQDTIQNISASSGIISGNFNNPKLNSLNFPIKGEIDSYAILSEFTDSVVTVGVGGKFTSLTGNDSLGLFDKLNKSIMVKDLKVVIISDINESGAIALNNSLQKLNSIQYSINIVPDTNIIRTLSGDINGGLIKLQSIKNLAIDGSFNNAGKYLKFINTPSSTVTNAATIQLMSAGGASGCNNITITNSIIVGPPNTGAGTYAIFAGDLSFGKTQGNIDSINIENNVIYRGYSLIYSYAPSLTKPNSAWKVRNNQLAGSEIESENNIYNGIYFYYNKNHIIERNIISGVKTASVFNGIYAYYCDSIMIRKNRINNIVGTGTSAINGIYIYYTKYNTVDSNVVSNLSNTTTTGVLYGIFCAYSLAPYINANLVKDNNCLSANYGARVYYCNLARFENNNIYNLSNTTGIMYGVYFYCYPSSTVYAKGDSSTIINNSISNLTSTYTTYALYHGYGRYEKIINNSIHLDGSYNKAYSTYSLYMTGSTTATLTSIIDSMYNNTITNNISNSNASYSNYAIYGATSNGITLVNSDYNNFWADDANKTNNYVGYWNGAAQKSLASLTGPLGSNFNSMSNDPLFLTGMYLVPSSTSPLLHTGVVTSVVTDILGNPRTTPSIGCYEESSDIEAPVIVYSPLTNALNRATRTFTANITDVMNAVDTNAMPRLYYKKSSQANNFASWKYTKATVNGSDFTFTFDYSAIGGIKEGDIIQYFVIAQDTISKHNVGINAGYSYNELTSVDLAASSFPISGYRTYTISPALSGVKTVGLGGDYLSLTGDKNGAFKTIANSILTSDLTLSVISDISESAVNELNYILRDGGDWKINIVPDGANPRIISGPKKSTKGGIIRLNNVSNVHIDGSYNGSGKYLTFTDSVTSLSVVVPIIQISGAGIGSGCKKINVENSNIIGSFIAASNTSAFGIFIGNNDLSDGSASSNDSISIIGNVFTRAAYGVRTGGTATNYNTNVLIQNNIIGSTEPTQYITVNGMYINGSRKTLVSQNEVMNVICANTNWNVGIGIGGNSDSTVIERNIVHGISYNGTASGAGQAIGVFGASNYVSIINNAVYDINGVGTTVGTSAYNPGGIRLAGGYGHKVYYNSVNLFGSYLSGTSTTVSSYAIAIHSSAQDTLDIRNNSFVNTLDKSTAIAGGSYAIGIFTTTFAFANSIFDNNNYYSSPSDTDLVKLGYAGDNKITLADWKATTLQDYVSKSEDPLYYASNLLVPKAGSPLLLSATTAVNVSNSITGAQRSANPTIGAYEEMFSPTLPAVVTLPTVDSIGQYKAITYGLLQNQGGSAVIAKGMVINLAPNPTLDITNRLAYSDNGPGLGTIQAIWTNLQQQRTYYVRAYATNYTGTSYGSDVPFTTLPVYDVPLVITGAVTYTNSTAKLYGEVRDDYYSPIIERGFIWGSHNAITISNALGKVAVGKINNSFINAYDTTITGLSSLTTYYYKPYATNGVGTSYGDYGSFTTLSDGYQVSGTVTYAQYTSSTTSKNMYLSGSKKMPFATWVKLMQNGVKVDSVMADSTTGAFTFPTVPNGVYTLAFDETHVWPTTPSTKAYQLSIQDVALIRQCAAQVRNFDSLQTKAVNVNLDYKNGKPYFNVQDVSFIRMKNGGVNPLPTQWMMPNWVYGIETSPSNASTDTPAVIRTDMTITVNSAPQSFIIRCISAADVNGQ